MILGMAYGYKVKEPKDRHISAASKLVQLATETTFPGALLVNDLPFCESFLLYWTSSTLIRTSTIHP